VGKGEAYSLLSALAWAFGVILYKRLGERLPPLALNLRKNLIVLAMLVPVLLALRGTELPIITHADLLVALGSGVIGIGLADTLYFRALNILGAGRLGVIGNFLSPFVIVLSFAFLGERLSALQLVGFALVTAGVAIVHERARAQGALDAATLRRGLFYGIAAIALMAVAIVMVKRVLERNDLLWISAVRLLGGVLAMVVLSTVARAQGDLRATSVRLDARGWALLVGAAFVGQMLSMLLWLAGYKYTQASVAAILNETASVFIVLLAWPLLGEHLSARRLMGVAFTISGVACMLWQVPGTSG
jgi:drug/metabolite transporter (DMT)-like permease